MTFNDIAIDDGRVAGLELRRDLIISFDHSEVLDILDLDCVAITLHVVDPITTTTSGRGSVYSNGRRIFLYGYRLLLNRGRTGCSQQDGQEGYVFKLLEHIFSPEQYWVDIIRFPVLFLPHTAELCRPENRRSGLGFRSQLRY